MPIEKQNNLGKAIIGRKTIASSIWQNSRHSTTVHGARATNKMLTDLNKINCNLGEEVRSQSRVMRQYRLNSIASSAHNSQFHDTRLMTPSSQNNGLF